MQSMYVKSSFFELLSSKEVIVAGEFPRNSHSDNYPLKVSPGQFTYRQVPPGQFLIGTISPTSFIHHNYISGNFPTKKLEFS